MSSQNNKKVPLDVHIEALLYESSKQLQESHGLKTEWEHYCKLESLISKITEREAARDEGDMALEGKDLIEWDAERRNAAFPALLEWLKEHSIDPEKVEIYYKDATQGFGLKTKVPLSTGDVVFTIPQKAILTSLVARNSKLKILADKDPLLGGMQNVLLAIYLVHERFTNPNSSWKRYIDSLPRVYETVLYFSKEEMAVLKNSPTAFREALRMLRNVTRQYAYFHIKFRKSTDSASRALRQVFTYNRYIWGVSAVTTRINYLPNPGGEPILSLIPLWDLCNHEESEVICTDYNDEQKILICYAGHTYAEDEEFTIFYGRRSSVDFLVHNGFVPQNFRNDSYCLELGVGMSDQNYNRKKAILGRFELDCQTTFLVRPDKIGLAFKLFAFVRIFLANDDELNEIEQKQNDLTFLAEPNEACWKFLSTRFGILKKASENSLNSTMSQLRENSANPSRITMILLQLLKNEQKVLEMLMHCSEINLTMAQKAQDENLTENDVAIEETNSSTETATDSQ